ncbi:hypothetical protein MTR67_035455 [Solanum verrucosum]|uniref:Uncharacterized protein n=1 Tax=Solanum verrucosum TaxID=315347 RepID=A0AAF0U9U0_SOLVR|nr:hypothetical protein MTR67_035455 [Solanum verrucosum]
MGDHIVEYVRNDLDLGEVHQLSIITDMQKGLEIVVQEVLPLEHRKYARYVLANWCKSWKGIERRRVFWRIPKSTFEVELKDSIQRMKKLGKACLDDLLWGIPCPHGVVALHYKELEPINYVASCYSKETYLSTYAHFIQSMNNMKMWSTSNNPIVKPPKIKMPGKPTNVVQGHNRRGCPTRNQVGPSQSTEPSSQAEATEREQEADQGVLVQLNHQELLHRRVINTDTRVTKRVDVVTGDIGYTPVRGFKWKEKTTITNSNLERMRAEKVIQTRYAATATANSQSQTSSSRKTHMPWKYDILMLSCSF